MKIGLVRMMKVLGLAVLICAAATQMSVVGQETEAAESISAQLSSKLVGVWEATVTTRNCQTGEPLGPAFQSLVTFHKGGTVSEIGTNTTTPFRSPGHGIWENGWNGENSFYMHTAFFPMTPAGAPIGKIKISQSGRYDPYSDQTESVGRFELRNLAGVLLNSGCSTAWSTRLR